MNYESMSVVSKKRNCQRLYASHFLRNRPWVYCDQITGRTNLLGYHLTLNAEGGATVGFRVIIDDLVPIPLMTLSPPERQYPRWQRKLLPRHCHGCCHVLATSWIFH